MIEIAAGILILLGGFFCLIAGVGILRMADIYGRMHASTKAGTLGLALVALAMMLTSPTLLSVLEPLFVFLFMIATAPVGAHLIGRAAFRTGIAVDPKMTTEDGCSAFAPRPASGVRPVGQPSAPLDPAFEARPDTPHQ